MAYDSQGFNLIHAHALKRQVKPLFRMDVRKSQRIHQLLWHKSRSSGPCKCGGTLCSCRMIRQVAATKESTFGFVLNLALKSLGRRLKVKMKKNTWRAVIAVGFVMFLFYSNLLMGKFERSDMGQKRGLVWAIGAIFTADNFEIGTIAALVGYLAFEFLRKNLRR